MQGQRYRTRFTLYRYGGLVVVACERCKHLAGVCFDAEDAIWDAAVHAACGQG
jgi:hypothetical protein